MYVHTHNIIYYVHIYIYILYYILYIIYGIRRRGRPKTRWTDQLNKFFKQGCQASNEFWMQRAQDEDSWDALEDSYVSFALGRVVEH